MSEAHIRDFLAQTKEDLNEGRPSRWTMCGKEDKGYQMTFGQAESIIKGLLKYPCAECKRRYLDEKESMSAEKVALNKFRIIVNKLQSFRSR